MAMNKKTKTTLILVGLAAAAFIIYRMYTAKQAAANSGTNSPTGQLGTNLNSVLTGLSAGPSTELNYYQTSTSTSTPVAVGTAGAGNTGSTAGAGSGTNSGGTGSRWPGTSFGKPWT
jgi:hypothetical protein